MRSLALLTTAFLGASLAASAQTARVAVPVGEGAGNSASAVGSVGVVGGIPSLTLSVPSLAGSIDPSSSFSPSLQSVVPAASVSVAPSAASLKTSASEASLPLSVVPTALRPTLPAASKADELREEARKLVAQRRLELSQNQSALPETSVGIQPNTGDLDALFDGSIPTSGEVFARASARGVGDAAIGSVIASAKSVDDAASRLNGLGLLGAKEAALASQDADSFRYLLLRLWRRTSPHVDSDLLVDRRWSVPALKVVSGGVTYYVHGVTHGRYGRPLLAPVKALVREIAAAGAELVSEQNLPAGYGYAYGVETLDHSSKDGSAAQLVPAANGASPRAVSAAAAVDRWWAPVAAAAALAWGVFHAATLAPWLALTALLYWSWLVFTGGLPLLRRRRRERAASALAAGLVDAAAQFADEAKNFFVADPKLEDLRGLELPAALTDPTDPYSARSKAMADAAALHAARTGAAEVHLVVGHLHQREVAASLSSAGEPKSQPA